MKKGPLLVETGMVSIGRTLIVSQSIDIRIDWLRVDDDEIVARLVATRNAVTDRLDSVFDDEFMAWSNTIEKDPEALPPQNPLGKILGAMRINVVDDLGVEHVTCESRVGGTGTEWVGIFSFTPGPGSAKELTFTAQDGDHVSELVVTL